ncbi:hypothetical protein EV385_4396 [Krasilnikovia cinnamomea]|uniref:DUF2637 domain-containing protein n=1 Tax=Krasilnikovia cinnamomea TaxID=349313 RepID=A0A4Q7ZNC3_9ACTN|nr:DUF2637 domain-containing protein [Krasilnikovia cinnamomea]RZU52530.1 hypothetical protein EV385_4396 [Krasilnikovia cinnamomea]
MNGLTATRVEGLVLVAILLVVAGFAGAASFTHVHDWTMRHSPAGTGDWFGWANAVISELVPIACALVIRRRRRERASVVYPVFLLLAAVALSLSAQVAVAVPGPSGWLLSAVPALAFLGLAKLVLSTAPPAESEPTSPTAVAATEPRPAESAAPTEPKAAPVPPIGGPTVPAGFLPPLTATEAPHLNGRAVTSGGAR